MPDLADEQFNALALYVAKLREYEEDVLLRRLSAYAGTVATAVALLAASFSPFGHPVAVFLVAEPALCTAAGLGVAEYVLRRSDEAPVEDVAARDAEVLIAGRIEER